MGLESKVVDNIEPAIDREKTCPLLLRVFCNLSGRHNSKADYLRSVPGNELQIYTWLDASLGELTKLITEVYPETKIKGTTFSFSVTYPIPHSRSYGMKEIGTKTIGNKGADDATTLKSKQFVIGDYLDVSINIARGGGGGAGNRDKTRSNDARRQNYRDYR